MNLYCRLQWGILSDDSPIYDDPYALQLAFDYRSLFSRVILHIANVAARALLALVCRQARFG